MFLWRDITLNIKTFSPYKLFIIYKMKATFKRKTNTFFIRDPYVLYFDSNIKNHNIKNILNRSIMFKTNRYSVVKMKITIRSNIDY